MDPKPGTTSRVTDSARRTGADALRLFKLLSKQPSWGVKLAVALGALVMLGAAAILVIPAVIVFLLVLLVGAAWQKARSLLAGAMPARDRDGRRNVRVVVRDGR